MSSPTSHAAPTTTPAVRRGWSELFRQWRGNPFRSGSGGYRGGLAYRVSGAAASPRRAGYHVIVQIRRQAPGTATATRARLRDEASIAIYVALE